MDGYKVWMDEAAKQGRRRREKGMATLPRVALVYYRDGATTEQRAEHRDEMTAGPRDMR